MGDLSPKATTENCRGEVTDRFSRSAIGPRSLRQPFIHTQIPCGVSPGFFILVAIFAVEFFMYFSKMRIGGVRINLGCIDGSVTEQLLYRANVGTIAEEIGRKCVAERVGRNDVCYARARDIFFQVPLDVAWGDAVETVRAAVYEQRFLHIFLRF